jgi:hypothetical protein
VYVRACACACVRACVCVLGAGLTVVDCSGSLCDL